MRVFAGLSFIIISLFFCQSINVAVAYPSSNPAEEANPKFEQAKALINKKEYNQAIPILKEIVNTDSKNADAYNYLGYSYRQTGNLDDALKYYQLALNINPNHKGANEYLGELYLMKKDLTKAEEHLAVLKKACPTGCIEYKTLSDHISAFKKNGN